MRSNQKRQQSARSGRLAMEFQGGENRLAQCELRYTMAVRN